MTTKRQDPAAAAAPHDPAAGEADQPTFTLYMVNHSGEVFWRFTEGAADRPLASEPPKPLSAAPAPHGQTMQDMVDRKIPLHHVPRPDHMIFGTYFVNLSSLGPKKS